MARQRFLLANFLATTMSLTAIVSACSPMATKSSAQETSATDFGVLWVKQSAEYDAIALQVYDTATNALAAYISDTSWSAIPGQTDAVNLPPAVILDIDQTVVSNVDFQLATTPPFADWKLDQWAAHTAARPLPGVAQFVHAAQRAGVAVFFITNRPCEATAGSADPCPQKRTTLDDLAEAGISTDPAHVMIVNEKPGWTQEKSVRRDIVAAQYRIIMLFGDDLGDFIGCVRAKVVAPCKQPATSAFRREQVEKYRRYWGAGWYILPNPMYGSWTAVK